MRILGLLLTAFALAACSDPINIDDEASVLSQNEIAIQWANWGTVLGSQGYSVEIYRTCNCIRPADYFYNYRLTVDLAGNNVLIEALDDNGSVIQILPDNPAYYPNMDEIFTLMEDAMDSGSPVFGFFHATEAYPTQFELGNMETYRIDVIGYF